MLTHELHPSHIVLDSSINKTNNFFCLYQNTRGLRSKSAEFYINVCTTDFDILCLSETWLSQDIMDSELFPCEFKIFRADRNFAASGKCRGGGVLLAHSASLQSFCQSLSKYNFPPEIDIVCVSFKLSRNLTVLVIYIPPAVNQNIYDSFLEGLTLLLSDLRGDLLILGDFNTPNFETPCDARSRSLNNFQAFCDVKQYNLILYSNQRKLDLVFSNTCCVVSRSDISPVSEDTMHLTLSVNVSLSPNTPSIKSNTSNVRFNFKRADFPNLYSSIAATDWSQLAHYDNVNSMCEIFYKLLMIPIEKHVPRTTNRVKRTPCWFSLDLIRLMKAKELARGKFRKSGTSANCIKMYPCVHRSNDSYLPTSTIL